VSAAILDGCTASDVADGLTGVARPSAPIAIGGVAPPTTYGSTVFSHGLPGAAWVNTRYSVPVDLLGLARLALTTWTANQCG